MGDEGKGIKFCESPPKDQVWIEHHRVFIQENSKGEGYGALLIPDDKIIPSSEAKLRPLRVIDPKYPIDMDFIKSSGILERQKFTDICCYKNSPSSVCYAYRRLDEFIAFQNTKDIGGRKDIRLTWEEVMGLVQCKELRLGSGDILAKSNYGPKKIGEGMYTDGTYHFMADPPRLRQMITVLENNGIKIPALDQGEGRRKFLIDNLKELTLAYDLQIEDLKSRGDMFTKQVGLTLGATILTLIGFGLINLPMQLKMAESIELQKSALKGELPKNELKNFTVDYIAEERILMAQDIFRWEILGRDEEAIELLKMWTRTKRANPLVIAEAGVGKDAIIHRALQLIIMHHKDVPMAFYDGTIKGILLVNPTAFTAGTHYRGDSDARANALYKAEKEGYAVYFPEIGGKAAAGTTGEEGGGGEAFSEFLKNSLADERYSKFASTATPDSFEHFVLKQAHIKDLKRRMPQLKLGDMHITELTELVTYSMVPNYEEEKNVEFRPEAIERAVNLGLLSMGHGEHDRYDSIDKLVISTVEMVNQERPSSNGRPAQITADDVITTAAKMQKVEKLSLVGRDFNETVPLKKRTIPNISYGYELMRKLDGADQWFKSRSKIEKRVLTRQAAQWMMAPDKAPPGVVNKTGELDLKKAIVELGEVHAREQIRKAVEKDLRFSSLPHEDRIAITKYIDETLADKRGGEAVQMLRDEQYNQRPLEHVLKLAREAAKLNGGAAARSAGTTPAKKGFLERVKFWKK